MLVDVLGENVGDTLTLLSPLENGSVEMVFVEVAGEYIDWLILLQERWHDTIQVQPIVEYQDGLICFKDKTAMEDVSQCHCCSISQSLSSLIIFGVAFPASTSTFLPFR
jgi:hypothetical protein